MRFFYYLFLFASIFFHKVLLSNLMNYPRLYPNFNRQPFVLPQGTPAFPICNSPHCMNHWMQQAIPLSQGRHFGYFLPAFVPSGVRSSKLSDLELRSNLRSRRWKRISLIGESYSKKRRFYKTEDSEEIVMVEQNSDTKQLTQKRGQTVYINLEDVTIPETNLEFFGKKPEVKEASPVEPEVKGSPVEPEVKGSPVEPEVKGSPVEPKVKVPRVKPKVKVPRVKPKVKVPRAKPKNKESSFIILSQDTFVFPGHAVKEIKDGCFVINKKDIQTEASFCIECIQDTPENSFFNSLLEGNFLKSLQKYLLKVFTSSKQKVKNQIGNLSEDQICSPGEKLSHIIKNFEKTCSPYKRPGGFKDFFQDFSCKSCKQGIPIELMMAMMSIESSGRCNAHNSEGENSIGLFQVNADSHQCTSRHSVKTIKNIQCLKDLGNNWNKATEILTLWYNITNGSEIKKPCKDWIKMNSDERDSFRRAVAGYNGGGGWVTHAIRTGRNNAKGDTSSYGKSYRKDVASWEEIRAFYFIQNLRKTRKTRLIDNNISNLAHTEAVLGREIKGSPIGMIEVWSQYKINFLKENPFQCKN